MPLVSEHLMVVETIDAAELDELLARPAAAASEGSAAS
jgi:hypothetical protein